MISLDENIMSTPEIVLPAQPNSEMFVSLYQEFGEDLASAREFIGGECQNPLMRKQFDDLEAEALYLLIRATEPETLVEISPCDGWSTTWILKALQDNQRGHLDSYDVHGNAEQFVPPDITTNWSLHIGDVRKNQRIKDGIDFLLIDSKHTYGFARWYLKKILPKVNHGSPVVIHDISSGLPIPGTPNAWTGYSPVGTEAWKVKRELRKKEIGFYTLNSASTDGFLNAALAGIARAKAGVGGDFSQKTRNPAIFFFQPSEPTPP